MALYAWNGVRLGEHSCNVAGLLLGLFSEELGVIAGRLRASPSHVLIAAGVAALLHDAGKAAKRFQVTVRRGHPSFTCHELVAGKIVYEVVDALLAPQTIADDARRGKLLAVAAATAALRHHHAMRTLGYCVARAHRQMVPGLSSKELLILASELEDGCPEAEIIAFFLRRLVKDYKPLEGPQTVENAARTLQKTYRVRRELLSLTASALTGLLSLADYLTATTLDKRAQDPRPRGYTKQVIRELQYSIGATGQETGQYVATRLREIATSGRKTLKQTLQEIDIFSTIF